jgi:ribonuclease HII
MSASQVEIDRFQFERALQQSGTTRIAGVDEVGRGPLAGPVVAAAAVLPETWIRDGLPEALQGLNDSKRLQPAQREVFFEFLTARGEIQSAVSVVEVGVIDSLNILRATHEAMNRSLAQLSPPPEHVLVDGLRVATIQFPQTAIVQGDARSYSIAAASVIAKVTRDRLMDEFHRQYPVYGFASNKGYGTAQHLAALAEHGPCPLHRRSFAPLKPSQLELFER